ncbi:MAG: proline dehydrogenase [Acidobacteria bacterium]|nr:MAG: proline dehydrogenase [Acidobacteriota bacterium]REK01535.1 MAG: proline dehydrogenase [Acidobacteriota bacterium]REK14491.1 MAG: proline dehydrogenase [Acidobacteriota bacterium]REK45206.1 MAG: proline dehydrogenase [Acidobacteriota bacterium]
MGEFRLDFQDTETAFKDKSNSELREKYRLFRLLNSPILNEIGTRSASFALSVGLPVEWLIKRTVFEQFCGGETIEECQATIDRLGNSGIGAILDYSVEGKTSEHDFEHGKEEVIRNLDRAKNDDDIPFAVFKITGIAPLGTLEKISSGAELKPSNVTKWESAQRRVREICEYARKIHQPVFIDAEESWIQNAIDQLAMGMMEECNREEPIVYTTIQLYRHDRLEYLKKTHLEAKEKGFILAVKLVRGAYMEKERERAKEMGYTDPIQPDKAATDDAFNAAVAYCLDNIDDISFVNGTHNEESTQEMAQLMEEKELPHDHPHCFFSQLYGMSDNLSYILADNGYNVSKYVPYGPVKDAVPYLIRRAQENTSVTGQMSRELDLISREMKRRGI